MSQTETFPALPLEAWEASKKTLHLYLQIVGKVALTQMPRKNHWWNITFRVSNRGLETLNIPAQDKFFKVSFDFITHKVIIQTSLDEERIIHLKDKLSVADFYTTFFAHLKDLNITVKILDKPYDVDYVDPFHTCDVYNTYQPEHVNRFWKVLLEVSHIFEEFAGQFSGKVSPVQLFWHSFDLAVTRFSGRKGPEMPAEARISDRDAYSHEVISAGFWAGDDNVRGAAFYSYTYPSPEGLDQEAIKPEGANWVEVNGSPMAVLMYDDIRNSDNPKQAIMDFLESTYQAGAKLARWDIEHFTVNSL